MSRDANRRQFLINTHPACDVWTMVCGVDRTSDLVPIKSADDGRIVPDAAPRKGAVQSACSIELQLLKGKINVTDLCRNRTRALGLTETWRRQAAG